MSALNRPASRDRAASASSGPINWVIAKLGARGIRAPKFHLFNVLGQHKLLFWRGCRSRRCCSYCGQAARRDAEVVILRVGHLRDCEYELQQHRRLARSRGVDAELQAKIFEGPAAEGLTDRQRALLTATDEFVSPHHVAGDLGGAGEHLNRSS